MTAGTATLTVREAGGAAPHVQKKAAERLLALEHPAIDVFKRVLEAYPPRGTQTVSWPWRRDCATGPWWETLLRVADHGSIAKTHQECACFRRCLSQLDRAQDDWVRYNPTP
jgi:hypothetical protein